MNSIDLAKMGLGNLFRRKTRTILTVLGVVIGTASILVMVSIGLGMNRAFEEEIGQYGSLTSITVHAPWGEESAAKLDDQALEGFRSIKNVDYAIGMINVDGEVVSGKYRAWGQIFAVDFDYLEKLELELVSGELPKVVPGENQAVMGGAYPNSFYNPTSRKYMEVTVDPYEDKFEIIPHVNNDGSNKKVKGFKFKVTGVTSEENWETANAIYIDQDTYLTFKAKFDKKYKVKKDKTRDKNKSKYNNIKIGVNKVKNVEDVLNSVKEMGFEAYSLTEWLNQVKKTSGMIQNILFAVGMVSLIVAAIGIANTMIMSIYERTKEIGIMKVIGAQLKDIKRLFLFEAGMIGFIGGVLGVAISYGVSFLINNVLASGGEEGIWEGGFMTNSYMPIWLPIAGLGFSVLIGLIAGFYPAVRATKLSALEAIRND